MEVFSSLHEPIQYNYFASVKQQQESETFDNKLGSGLNTKPNKKAEARRQIAKFYQRMSIKDFVDSGKINPYKVLDRD